MKVFHRHPATFAGRTRPDFLKRRRDLPNPVRPYDLRGEIPSSSRRPPRVAQGTARDIKHEKIDMIPSPALVFSAQYKQKSRGCHHSYLQPREPLQATLG
jgi:hypothetical protein